MALEQLCALLVVCYLVVCYADAQPLYFLNLSISRTGSWNEVFTGLHT